MGGSSRARVPEPRAATTTPPGPRPASPRRAMTLPTTSSTEPDPAPRAGGPALGRRAMIAGAGVAAIGAVAACGGGGSTTDNGGQAQTGDAPQGSPGTVLGPASAVPVGGGAIYADAQVVVTQPQQGTFTGLSAICPHQGCTVSQVTDGQIVCPCHNSRFSLDGAVVDGPAQRPLDPRQVTVADGSITLA
ncbi:Rieske 2Fe-2S domain-containing protein [Pseudonocardia sp. ICBG1122]|nr:Rieske 2Fe-2S domain-containing protein [Pseudonocardia pini]NWJ74867.1 Rieske 2Fe-2S domain-containing protein [Pseudonocardia pini]